MEYLGFQIEEKDIERANRVGGGKDDDGKGPRAIVMELISERLKHSILREAAVKLRLVFLIFFHCNLVLPIEVRSSEYILSWF